MNHHSHTQTMNLLYSACKLVTKRVSMDSNDKKMKSIKTTLGHEFVLKKFSKPTYCSHCTGFLWGIHQPGMQCRVCHFTVHESCHKLVLFECAGPQEKYVYNLAMAKHFKKQHQLKAHTYHKPTNCAHCGFLLYGFWHQGLHCSECLLNFHWKCFAFAPDYCAVFSFTEPIGRVLFHFRVRHLTLDRILLTCVLQRHILTCKSETPRHLKEKLKLKQFFYPGARLVVNHLGYDSQIVHSDKAHTELYIPIDGAELEPLHHRRLVLQLIQDDDILGAVSFNVRDLIKSPGKASGWYRLLPADVGCERNERMPAPGQSWTSILRYLNILTMPHWGA